MVVAIGGGSLLDLGGFVAATFLRGIDFVHLPTTLLSQVDAAIGGKTGIDLPEAKNSVGAFRQPAAVVVDTAFLDTLPERELRAGLQEVVKIAAILDRDFFERLELQLDAVLAGDALVRATAIERAIALRSHPHTPIPASTRRRTFITAAATATTTSSTTATATRCRTASWSTSPTSRPRATTSATSSPAYLNDLLALGVDGFRLDASKHMPAADIAAIKAQAVAIGVPRAGGHLRRR